MKYGAITKYYIDPDSIELEDFCRICQYVLNTTLLSPSERYFLSLMTQEHVDNIEDTEVAVVYHRQKYHRNIFTAELQKMSIDGGENWIYVRDYYYVKLKIVTPDTPELHSSKPLAVISLFNETEGHQYFLTKQMFDEIFQEDKDNNEETSDSDDGNSGIGEELNS